MCIIPAFLKVTSEWSQTKMARLLWAGHKKLDVPLGHGVPHFSNEIWQLVSWSQMITFRWRQYQWQKALDIVVTINKYFKKLHSPVSCFFQLGDKNQGLTQEEGEVGVADCWLAPCWTCWEGLWVLGGIQVSGSSLEASDWPHWRGKAFMEHLPCARNWECWHLRPGSS